jgi:hypothetical protein
MSGIRSEGKGVALAAGTIVLVAIAAYFAWNAGWIPGIDPPPKEHRFTIPAGAAERAAKTGELNGIPLLIKARQGDKLVITNNDSEMQTVAGYPIAPNDTTEVPLTRAGRFEAECSVHRDKSTTLVVSER